MACLSGLMPTAAIFVGGVPSAWSVWAAWLTLTVVPGVLAAALAPHLLRAMRGAVGRVERRTGMTPYRHSYVSSFILYLAVLLPSGAVFAAAWLIDLESGLAAIAGAIAVLGAGFTLVVLSLVVATVGAARPATFFSVPSEEREGSAQ